MRDRSAMIGSARRLRIMVAVVFAVQVVCAVFFVSEIIASVLGLPVGPFDWHVHELMEIGAAIGLILGVVFGLFMLRIVMARSAAVESQLRVASGAFMELLNERFDEWALTPAERDVALFALKGLSTSEIAGLRRTSEGTVKAQSNAIYRKAGVGGRPQLLSLFIDDLMGDGLAPLAR